MRNKWLKMNRFLNNVRAKGAVIIIIVDHFNNVFGAFLGESFKCSDDYYASAECFLFKFDQKDPEKVRISKNKV